MLFIQKEREGSLLSRETIAQTAAIDLVHQFANVKVGEKVINTPFWMNDDPDLKDTPYFFSVPGGGKYTPEEVQSFTEEALARTGFNINIADDLAIRNFMKTNGIGVDCSGLVYQICRRVYESLGGIDFGNKVVGANNMRGITKTSAYDLTSPKNSIQINKVNEIKPGDIIRGLDGKHALVVIGMLTRSYLGAHSSDGVAALGVSTFTINITDEEKDIFHQDWSEYNIHGIKYNERLLQLLGKDDGVWRLNIIDELYRQNF
jgi:hypothetical protein